MKLIGMTSIVKRTLRLVMVTTNGVAHNSHYNLIQNEITLEHLFAE